MFNLPNVRPFEIVLYAVFIVLALAAVFLLMGYERPGSTSNNPYGSSVEVWGSFPYDVVNEVFENINDQNPNFQVVEYVSIPADRLGSEFVNALAEGRSPDLVILPHTELVNQRSKLFPIPYSTDGFSERDIRNRYIDGAELFALQDGVYGVPYLVDPLVMYWNRDLFATAAFAGPPQTWEQLVGSVVNALTIRDNSRNIVQSAVAFGEYSNVRNVLPIISMLLMQAGSQLVEDTERGYFVALNEGLEGSRPPMEASVQFFTEFANVSNPLYSWNRAREQDRLAFIAGDLALYFGFASEGPELIARNPNLNFDMTIPPQGASATIRRTYGTFYSLVVPRGSRNPQGSLAVAQTLATPQNSLAMALATDHAPVSRAALQADVTDPFVQVAFQAALFARGWLSPSPQATATAIETMISEVNSNRSRVSSAVSDAVSRMRMAY
jgi:ABC-type glycerol-3-phosphate transport system substrate-binding protein